MYLWQLRAAQLQQHLQRIFNIVADQTMRLAQQLGRFVQRHLGKC